MAWSRSHQERVTRKWSLGGSWGLEILHMQRNRKEGLNKRKCQDKRKYQDKRENEVAEPGQPEPPVRYR